MPSDPGVHDVVAAIMAACAKEGSSPEEFFGDLVRQALDEVIDGPRTRRWSLDQLSSTEKGYVGTKIEIIIKAALDLEGGVNTDVVIAGHEVDIKWSKSLNWMIGPENVDQVCLGLGLRGGEKRFSVGVFRATAELLREGRNRDGKVSPTAKTLREQVAWIVKDAGLPQDFIATLSKDLRDAILAESSAQSRVRRLVALVPETPIPRHAFLTVAGTLGDPIRRLRKDAHKKNPLGGMVILHCRGKKALLAQLGFKDLPDEHWMAVSEKKLKKLGLVP